MTIISTPEVLPSPQPHWESLFPIPVEQVAQVQQRLLQVTEDDLRGFVDVRREGTADDPMTILYGAGFATWHQVHGDFSSDKATQTYRIGKLYGAQAALDRYVALTGDQLVADDADAYHVARVVVEESYKELPEGTQWERDYLREKKYTGGNIFAVLNAVLHDRTMEQYAGVYEGTIPEDEALESFYTGLVDAAIFINTYASWRDFSRVPLTFPLPPGLNHEELPQEYHELTQMIQEEEPAVVHLNMEGSDTLSTDIIDSLRPGAHNTRLGATWLNGQRIGFVYAPILKQTGPNDFVFAHELRAIYNVTPRATSVDRRRSAGRMSIAMAAGANALDFWAAPLSLVVPSTLVAAGLGALIGRKASMYHSEYALSTIWKATDYDPENKITSWSLQN